MDDACAPAAPLSKAVLTVAPPRPVAYHGWAFEPSSGACARNPQANDAVAAAATPSARACVASYPTRVHKSVLWVWPWEEDCLSVVADERAQPEGILAGVSDDAATYTRDLPYSWDTLLENIVDPAHIPFAHHGLQGKREDAIAINMTNPSSVDAVAVTNGATSSGLRGFSFEFGDRTMGKRRAGTGEFRAPFVVAYNADFEPTLDKKGRLKTSRPFNLTVVCVPTGAGRSRAIIYGGTKPEAKAGEEKAKAGGEEPAKVTPEMGMKRRRRRSLPRSSSCCPCGCYSAPTASSIPTSPSCTTRSRSCRRAAAMRRRATTCRPRRIGASSRYASGSIPMLPPVSSSFGRSRRLFTIARSSSTVTRSTPATASTARPPSLAWPSGGATRISCLPRRYWQACVSCPRASPASSASRCSACMLPSRGSSRWEITSTGRITDYDSLRVGRGDARERGEREKGVRCENRKGAAMRLSSVFEVRCGAQTRADPGPSRDPRPRPYTIVKERQRARDVVRQPERARACGVEARRRERAHGRAARQSAGVEVHWRGEGRCVTWAGGCIMLVDLKFHARWITPLSG